MSELSKFFGLGFSALLPLVNPLGSALVFLSLVGDAPADVYRALARRIAISTTIFLIVVEAGGTLILKFFGISLPVVQVSGGLALAAMGWKLLSQEKPDEKQKSLTWMAQACDNSNKRSFTHLHFPSQLGPAVLSSW